MTAEHDARRREANRLVWEMFSAHGKSLTELANDHRIVPRNTLYMVLNQPANFGVTQALLGKIKALHRVVCGDCMCACHLTMTKKEGHRCE